MQDELQSSLICTYLQGTISILSVFFSNTVLSYLMVIMMVIMVMLLIDSTLLLIEWKCSGQRFPTSRTQRSGLGTSGRYSPAKGCTIAGHALILGEPSSEGK